jgi:protein-disulfide isomerase
MRFGGEGVRTVRGWLMVASVAAGALVGTATAARAADTLMKFRGQAVTEKDLTPAQQLELHDAKLEAFMKKQAMVESWAVDRYLDEQVRKTGKSRADVEAAAGLVKTISDKEAKDWFEANKGRLPPGMTYEQVAQEVKNHLAQEAQQGARAELVEKLKKEGVFAFDEKEPESPQFAFDTAGLPVRGGKTARVQIVEFADYQCPHCKAAGEVLDKITKKYGDKIALVFMDFPINPSGISKEVAYGAACADEQGKYWDYHDLAYQEQHSLTKESPLKLAQTLKLDEKKFASCLASEAPKKRVERTQAAGEKIGISGTPWIFINGRRVRNYEEPDMIAAIDKALGKG